MMPTTDQPPFAHTTERPSQHLVPTTSSGGTATVPAPRNTSARGPLVTLLLGPTGAPGPIVWLGLIALAIWMALFWDILVHLVFTWSTDANYSHGFLVPLISLYFANEAARRGPMHIAGGTRLGLGLLIAALIGRLVTSLLPVGIVGGLSFLLGLAGLLALFAGRAALRRFGFALAFLVFMIPLPIALYTMIASPLQLLVSKIAAAILSAIGTPVLCQGNLMTLPGGAKMFVAEACSGMRQLTGFLALTIAVAYLAPRPFWYRALIVVSSVPIAMLANIIRVVATGLIMHHIGEQYAMGTFHTIEGLLLMGLGLAILAAECSVLNWAFPLEAERTSQADPAAVDSPLTDGVVAGPSVPDRKRRLSLVFGTLLTGSAVMLALMWAIVTPRPLLKQPLATLPLQLGDWVGEDVPVDPDVLRNAQCDDYLNRRYENTRRPGQALSLWINYSREGLNLRHSPEVCLPSGGWEKVESQTREIDIARPTGPPTRLTRLMYSQGELVQGVGFWYYIFGEGAIERYIRKLPITNRSSHGRTTRGSGMTVEIFCPGEFDADGQHLADFATALLDGLDPILPTERANYFRP